jgi:hypothetical protein
MGISQSAGVGVSAISSRWLSRTALAALALAGTVGAPLLAQTHLVIVSGLGGEKKYTDSFAHISAALADAAAKRFGIPDAEISWFGEDSVSKQLHYRGLSTKANVERRSTSWRRSHPDQIVSFSSGMAVVRARSRRSVFRDRI